MVTVFPASASPLIALSAVYRFDSDLSFTPELKQYADGSSDITCKLFTNLKDVAANKQSLFFLTSSYHINDVVTDTAESISFGDLAGFVGLIATNGRFVSARGTELYANGVDASDSAYFQLQYNDDNTCSILHGDYYVTVNIEAPHDLVLQDRIEDDEYKQQKFKYTLQGETVQLFTEALYLAGKTTLRQVTIGYNTTTGLMRCNGIFGVVDANNSTFTVKSDSSTSLSLSRGFNVSNRWVRYFNEFGDKANNKNTTVNTLASVSAVPVNYLCDVPYENLIEVDHFDRITNVGSLKLNLANLKNVQTPEYGYHDNYADKIPIQPSKGIPGSTRDTRTILLSGTIVDSTGAALSAVTLNGLPAAVTTSVAGTYSIKVPITWSGTVVPSKNTYTFEPSINRFNNVRTTQLLNITGTKQFRYYGILDYNWTSSNGVDFNSRTALLSTTEDYNGVDVGWGESFGDDQARFSKLPVDPTYVTDVQGPVSAHYLHYVGEAIQYGRESILVDWSAIKTDYPEVDGKELALRLRGNWYGSLDSTHNKMVSATFKLYRNGSTQTDNISSFSVVGGSLLKTIAFTDVVTCNYNEDVNGEDIGTIYFDEVTEDARFVASTEMNANSADLPGTSSQDEYHAVVRYRWIDTAGNSFYSRNALVNVDESVNLRDAGWADTDGVCRSFAVPNGSTEPFVEWKPSTSIPNTDLALVNYNNILNLYPSLSGEPITTRLRGFWFGAKQTGTVTIEASLFRGGEMIYDPALGYVNDGGVYLKSTTLSKVVDLELSDDVEGEDMATLTFTASSETFSLAEVTSKNGDRAVACGSNYGVIEYEWTPSAGESLHTRTIYNSAVYGRKMEGYYSINEALSAKYDLNAIEVNYAVSPNVESVLVDLTTLSRDYSASDVAQITTRANWFQGKLTGAVTVRFKLYNGGFMVVDGSGRFANSGGNLLETHTFSGTVSSDHPIIAEGQNIADIFYDYSTNTASISAALTYNSAPGNIMN